MAFQKTFVSETGAVTTDAYQKIVRFEFHAAGATMIKVPVLDENNEPVLDENDVPVTEHVLSPNITADVQVLVFGSKERADANLPPSHVYPRFRLALNAVDSAEITQAVQAVGAIDSVMAAFGLIRAILYRALKKLPEFSDAADV